MLAQVDIERGLSTAWENVVTFAPKLLGFFIILLIGWFIAKALSKLTNTVLERVGFDRWVERGAVRDAFARSNTEPSDVVGVVVFWTIFLIALQLAFGIWGPNPISDLLAGLIAYLPNVFVAVLIVVIAGALARVVTEVLTATLGAVSGGEWIARGAGIAILVVGIFAALNQLQVAPEIVNGLFYAVLAIIVGSAIVAVGGGGIRTMQRYWERWSAGLERTAAEVRVHGDPEAGRQRLDERREAERSALRGTDDTSGAAGSATTPPPPPPDEPITGDPDRR
jgi:hypothetical protein